MGVNAVRVVSPCHAAGKPLLYTPPFTLINDLLYTPSILYTFYMIVHRVHLLHSSVILVKLVT